MALALIKRFPYHCFIRTHFLLAASYLVLAGHATLLVDFSYWKSPFGVFMALLLAAGSASAVVLLFGRHSLHHKTVGEAVSVVHHDLSGTLEVDIQLKGRWPGHRAGQFAFVTFHSDEGAHPFTISSAWTGNGQLQFTIKGLGDYTRALADRLKVGDMAKVEGPYGRFDFATTQQRQVWVGGGVGITPFIARMKAIAEVPDGRAVDLFYCAATYDPEAIRLIEGAAKAAGVQLHVLSRERDGQLDAQRLCKTIPLWRDADLWFCGPSKFGKSLREGMVARGLPKARFHQELFEMR
jgi:predicted ferric reductase